MAMTAREVSRAVSPALSQLAPVSGSPSIFSIASTANPLSQYSLPLPPPRPAHTVITKADLERSQEAYSNLLASAKAYRVALASLSTAASTFGSALEACARLKEARAESIGPAGAPGMSASFTTKGACTADTLLSASGVHHLIANHKQILSETVYRSFEVPLLHDLDKWQSVIDDEEETYQANIRAQSREVKRLEKEGLKLHKQRRRDVARFRAHLVELTQQLDGLTALHATHARTLLRESQETSGRIVDASCSLVRAEVDIFESLARKGWSGGGLDDLLEKGQDLFATEYDGGHHQYHPNQYQLSQQQQQQQQGGSGGDGVKLFSILPPKSILADSTVSGGAGGPESSLLIETRERYQSLSAVAAADRKPSDGESVFSADFNKPRSARPFSPQPIRRAPTDVTFDALVGGSESAARLRFGEGVLGLPITLAKSKIDEDEGVEMRRESRQWARHNIVGAADDEDEDDEDDDDNDDDDDDDDDDEMKLGTLSEQVKDGSREPLRDEPSPESTWGSPGSKQVGKP